MAVCGKNIGGMNKQSKNATIFIISSVLLVTDSLECGTDSGSLPFEAQGKRKAVPDTAISDSITA
jgi:hypothetical protein